MPRYEFVCEKRKKAFELIMTISEHEKSKVRCPTCVHGGTLTYASQSGGAATQEFDFVIGADGAGSVVRDALLQQIAGFTVETKSLPNYCTMIELDRVGDQLDKHYLHGLSTYPFCVAGAIKGEHGPTRPGGSAPSARRPSRCSPP